MKNLTKILTGVGITAATLLGATIPATAAPTPDASSDRLIGQFVLDTNSNNIFRNNVQDATPGPRISTTPNMPAKVYTFPAQGAEGPVIHQATGLCLTDSGEYASNTTDPNLKQTYVYGLPCDGSDRQQFRLDGQVLKYVKDSNYAIGLTGTYNLSIQPSSLTYEQVNIGLLVPQLSEETAPLTASIDSVDHANFSAIASGTGEPGATITITGPTGPLTTLVNENGDWSLEIPGLAAGENVLPVTQTTGTDVSDPIDLTVIIKPLETPSIDPLMAGGASMLALAIMGGTLVRRKLSIR